MAAFYSFGFISMLIQTIVVSQDLSQDPCESYHFLYDNGSRSINCAIYHKESQDRFIDEGWRRVQIEDTGEDLMMPTECVTHGFCGSHSGVWLNGSHPSVEDGVVDRTGCSSMFSSCCHTQYPIQIKNCSSFMVYNLPRTLSSDTRYCFGDSLVCGKPTAQTTTALSVRSTTHAQRDVTISEPESISTTTTQKSTTVTATTTTPTTTTTQKPTTVTDSTTTQKPTTVTAAPPTTTTIHKSTTVTEAPTTPTKPQQATTKASMTSVITSTALLEPEVHVADDTTNPPQVIGEPISGTIQSDKDMLGLAIGLSVVIVILAIIASGFAVLYFRSRNMRKIDFDIAEQAMEPTFKEDAKI